MANKLILKEVMVGDLKVGDEFIDFQNGGHRYTIGWISNRSAKVECYPETDNEVAVNFDIKDLVQVEKCDYGVAA